MEVSSRLTTNKKRSVFFYTCIIKRYAKIIQNYQNKCKPNNDKQQFAKSPFITLRKRALTVVATERDGYIVFKHITTVH